jgi:CDP-glycerol glycerophosphotransferase
VSVVVPVYQAVDYLDECLVSVRGQSYPHLDVVIVDDGSTDGSAEVCARHAAADPRLRVHRQHNAGLGAARNVGISLTTGDYLTFLDADDTLPPDAYELLVRSLEGSGSDFAVGSVQRVTHGVRRTPAWIAEVHQRDRTGITIDEFPTAVRDVIACNRLFRRGFWERAGLRFPEGVAYEDHVPMMAAYVRAAAFDLLVATTYYWRIREDATSIGQQKHLVANLSDRLAAKRAAWQLLSAEASEQVRAAWRLRVLDMDLPLFIEVLPDTDASYFEVLRDGVREHLTAAGPGVLAQVRAERRVKELLIAEGRRDDVLAVLAAEQREGPLGPTDPVGDALVARYDGIAGLTEDDRRLPERQTSLRATLRRCRWASPGVLDVELSAYIPYLDLTDRQPSLAAWWVDEDGNRTDAGGTQFSDPEITRGVMPTWAGYDASGLRLTTDLRTLIGTTGPAVGGLRRWHLEVEVSAAGLTRSGAVRYRDGRGSAADLLPSGLPPDVRLRLDHTREHGLVVEAARSVATLVGAVADGAALELTMGAAEPLTRVVAAGPGPDSRRSVDPRRAGDAWRARFDARAVLPQEPADRVTFRVVADELRGGLGWPLGSVEDWLPLPGAPGVHLRRNSTGTVALVRPAPALELCSADLDEGLLRVSGRWLNRPTSPVTVELGDGGRVVPMAERPPAEERSSPTWQASLPAGTAVWTLGARSAAGEAVRVLVSPSLLGRLPALALRDGSRWVLVRVRGGGFGVLVEPLQWVPDHLDGSAAPDGV